jgi:hypothetical protein
MEVVEVEEEERRKTKLAILSGGRQGSALSPRFPQRSFIARRRMKFLSFLSFFYPGFDCPSDMSNFVWATNLRSSVSASYSNCGGGENHMHG